MEDWGGMDTLCDEMVVVSMKMVKNGNTGRKRPNKTWMRCVKEDILVCESDVYEEMTGAKGVEK